MTMRSSKVRNTTRTTSLRIRHTKNSRNTLGVRTSRPDHETLGPHAIRARQVEAAMQQRERVAEMTPSQRRAFEQLRELPPADQDSDQWITLDSVMDGNHELNVSHAGGELSALTDMAEEWDESRRFHRVDYRTRRDRTERRTEAFEKQMVDITDAYLEWSYMTSAEGGAIPTEAVPVDSGEYSIRVVDTFTYEDAKLTILPTDKTIASTIVRQGCIPSSPLTPSVCITIQCLELYRVAHLRSPHLSVQAFVKTLCDLHSVQFCRYLARQFSIALDVYLDIRRRVDRLVQAELNRDSPDWRLRHACPACTYKLRNEKPLIFALLYTMDGNDSLKRIRRRMQDDEGIPGPSCEHIDTRTIGGDFYLARAEVDKWAEQGIQEMMSTDGAKEDADYNPCADRWKNMKDDITKRMWAIFDETGIFLSLCRHGFSLVIADMVQSGELAKYPLAVVEKMLDVFGRDLGGGFDIGCRFETTLDNSPLGPRARELNHTSLVGSFHGHAHRRLCQLRHLATYIKGLGLEDLEGCERAFSKSNSLAAPLRYASVFHRIQSIAAYFEHNDNMEVFQNLTTFLYNNYKQARDILDSGPTALALAMQDLGLSDSQTFETWREEERTYLEGLAKEPVIETLEMEYYQKLNNLGASSQYLEAARTSWLVSTPEIVSSGIRDRTRSIETERRHALEEYEKDLKVVQDLEKKLNISVRWEPGSDDWVRTGKLVTMRKYQRALDRLEGLIVARMFELTKMNMSQTGYKLRKHIAKALQTRSQAIRSALDTYNAAAHALTPPRQQLEWKEVIEYAFLADFDLLRDARQDISHRPWATPAGRLAMDLHFKISRAREEIDRLDVEVRRVATYLRDEDCYLRYMEDKVRTSNARIAHQIRLHRLLRGRFHSHHKRRLREIARLPGFSGDIRPGISERTGKGESASVWEMLKAPEEEEDDPMEDDDRPEDQQEADEEEEAEEAEEELIQRMSSVLTISHD